MRGDEPEEVAEAIKRALNLPHMRGDEPVK